MLFFSDQSHCKLTGSAHAPMGTVEGRVETASYCFQICVVIFFFFLVVVDVVCLICFVSFFLCEMSHFKKLFHFKMAPSLIPFGLKKKEKMSPLNATAAALEQISQ